MATVHDVEDASVPSLPLTLRALNGKADLQFTADTSLLALVNCLSGERAVLPRIGPNEKWKLVICLIMEYLS